MGTVRLSSGGSSVSRHSLDTLLDPALRSCLQGKLRRTSLTDQQEKPDGSSQVYDQGNGISWVFEQVHNTEESTVESGLDPAVLHG